MMETGEVRELAGRGDKWMRRGGGRSGGWVWLGRFCVGGCFVTARAALGSAAEVVDSKRTSEMTAQVPSLVPRLSA